MNKLILFLGFVLCLQIVFGADVCDEATKNTCKTCTQTAGCGWCSATQKCSSGTAEGPTAGQCIHAWQFAGTANDCNECTQNAKIVDCRSCLAYPDCCWDSASGKCQEIGFTGGTCNYNACPCEDWGSCSDCIYAPGDACEWCQSSDSCMEKGGTCSDAFKTHTCPCNTYVDCDGCRSTTGCKWCNDKGGCFDFSDESCQLNLNSNCLEYCAGFGECTACNARPGCTWSSCDGKEGCIDSSFTAGCLVQHSCSVSCESKKGCEQCVGSSSCSWCEGSTAGTGSCVDTNSKPKGCLLSHTCCANAPSGGFSGGSFVGGMFLVAGLVVFAAGGFIFYRRQQAHSNYAQVN